jgi:hypothetical protein
MWRSSVGFLVVAGLMEVQKVRRVGTGRREKERRAPWRWIQSGAWRWTAPIGRVGAVGRRRIRILCRKSFYGRGAVVAIATVCWHPMLAGSLTVLSLPSSLTANSISLSAPSLSKFPTPLGSVISLSLSRRRRRRAQPPPRGNHVLNACGSNGRRLGNRLGVIRLMYAGMESAMVAVRDRDDWINSVAAGLGTGAVFRAANGPRSAMVAVTGALGGVLTGGATACKQLTRRYGPAI